MLRTRSSFLFNTPIFNYKRECCAFHINLQGHRSALIKIEQFLIKAFFNHYRQEGSPPQSQQGQRGQEALRSRCRSPWLAHQALRPQQIQEVREWQGSLSNQSNPVTSPAILRHAKWCGRPRRLTSPRSSVMLQISCASLSRQLPEDHRRSL